MAKTLDAAGVKRLIQEIKGANKNLNAPIPISTENTPESMAQNVKNIADHVEKAKAAGVANVNGMAVTCLIDNDYSGVGYLYGDTAICGIKTNDALEAPSFFDVDPSGSYHENEVLVKGLSDQITSDLLVEGARKPIVITGDMTEVDEETYQKLLKGDTDVIANFGEGIFIESQAKFNMGDTLNLIFGYSQFDESNDGAIATYTICINTSAPHTLTLAAIGLCEPVSKSTLSPVLQEIDLTGTDADRKAKLDKFETDWKALTGADYLTGARFVGKFGITDDVERNITGIMTYCAGDTATDANDNCFYGICNGYSMGERKSQIAVKVSCTDGSLTITPLFSHLEAITIKTRNTADDKAANVAAIKAYVDNLTALGVDTTKGFLIPINNIEGQCSGFISRLGGTNSYMGIITSYGTPTFGIAVSVAGEYYSYRFQTDSDNSLTTTSKQIVGAINEVNANAVHSDKLVPTLEAITIYTDNTPEHKQANLDNIAAYKANLQALGVDTTKGFLVPISCGDLQGYVISRNSVQNSPYVGYISNGTTVEDCKNVLIQPTTGQVYTYTLGLKKDVDNVKTDVASLQSGLSSVETAAVTNRADLDRTMIRVASPDDRALPLLCGQPPILFGAGTPKESIVPDNWNQYDPTTGEGYNWNGKPSAIGQQYVDTTAASGGRYIAVRNGEWDLKWINC